MNGVRIRGAAPTDAELLRLFVELANDYDRLSAAFPVSVSSAELLQSPSPDSERWHRVVRALALRKFVLGAQDAVRVDRVVEAYARCLIADEPAVHEMGRAFHEIEEGIGENVGTFEDILYGNLLHGEYERHGRNRARQQQEKDLAVWLVGESAEFLVRNVRNSIVAAAQGGRLKDEAANAVNAAYGSSRVV
jgi:hypothetical protein